MTKAFRAAHFIFLKKSNKFYFYRINFYKAMPCLRTTILRNYNAQTLPSRVLSTTMTEPFVKSAERRYLTDAERSVY